MSEPEKTKEGKEGKGKFSAKAKKDQFNERKRATLSKSLQQNSKPPTVFSQKANSENLDQFIKRVLSTKQIDEVEILDLSRHKISELSDRVKFYMRMLRKVKILNLYANKLRKVPLEIGKECRLQISQKKNLKLILKIIR